MGDKKKGKKKCCGKFVKKGKHCSSCPIAGTGKECKPDKDYCRDCSVKDTIGAKKKKKDKKSKKKK